MKGQWDGVMEAALRGAFFGGFFTIALYVCERIRKWFAKKLFGDDGYGTTEQSHMTTIATLSDGLWFRRVAGTAGSLARTRRSRKRRKRVRSWRVTGEIKLEQLRQLSPH